MLMDSYDNNDWNLIKMAATSSLPPIVQQWSQNNPIWALPSSSSDVIWVCAGVISFLEGAQYWSPADTPTQSQAGLSYQSIFCSIRDQRASLLRGCGIRSFWHCEQQECDSAGQSSHQGQKTQTPLSLDVLNSGRKTWLFEPHGLHVWRYVRRSRDESKTWCTHQKTRVLWRWRMTFSLFYKYSKNIMNSLTWNSMSTFMLFRGRTFWLICPSLLFVWAAYIGFNVALFGHICSSLNYFAPHVVLFIKPTVQWMVRILLALRWTNEYDTKVTMLRWYWQLTRQSSNEQDSMSHNLQCIVFKTPQQTQWDQHGCI